MLFEQTKTHLFKNWLNKRLPRRSKQSFDLGNVFILPSKYCLTLVSITFAVYILGTNYANNLVLLLAYFIASVLLIGMHISFFNLSGLTLQLVAGKPIFLQQELNCKVIFEAKHPIYSIELNHQDGRCFYARIPKGKQECQFSLKPTKRGWYQPERIKIESYAPLGWFRVWSLPNFAIKQLVYPQPIPCPQWLAGTGLNNSGDDAGSKQEAEDFQGLREYVQTDSYKHIAWKQLAKGKGWVTKVFSDTQSSLVWYSYYKIQADNHEDALSKLTWLVLQAKNRGITFGIELPEQTIQPAQGERFIERCLQALAEHK